MSVLASKSLMLGMIRRMLREAISKCICGENSFLRFVNKCSRMGEHTVNVLGVPVYICSEECGEQFMSGPDSLLFAQRIKEAASRGVKEIRF